MQCSISECRSESVETVKISFRETRNLCRRHYEIYLAKDAKHRARFTKASEM